MCYLGSITIYVSFLPSTACFEIIEDEKVKVSGKIYAVDEGEEVLLECPPAIKGESDDSITLNTEDVYQELRLRSYEYQGQFKGILQTQANGKWYATEMLQLIFAVQKMDKLNVERLQLDEPKIMRPSNKPLMMYTCQVFLHALLDYQVIKVNYL